MFKLLVYCFLIWLIAYTALNFLDLSIIEVEILTPNLQENIDDESFCKRDLQKDQSIGKQRACGTADW